MMKTIRGENLCAHFLTSSAFKFGPKKSSLAKIVATIEDIESAFDRFNLKKYIKCKKKTNSRKKL